MKEERIINKDESTDRDRLVDSAARQDGMIRRFTDRRQMGSWILIDEDGRETLCMGSIVHHVDCTLPARHPRSDARLLI
jgi:sulfate adenylyltransferase subunit 1 (EFTu-like GTPase family)